MDAVAAAAARSLMTERVDRRRRMVMKFRNDQTERESRYRERLTEPRDGAQQAGKCQKIMQAIPGIGPIGPRVDKASS